MTKIGAVLNKDQMRQYLKSADKAIKADQLTIKCPNKECGVTMSFPENEWIVLCPGKCKKWICRYCGKPPHYNVKCAKWKAHEAAKEGMKGTKDFQWCKKCGQGNQRTEACNHVVC